MLTIIQAETPEHIATARDLMVEYATWLEYNLCFQGFEEAAPYYNTPVDKTAFMGLSLESSPRRSA